MIKKPDTSNIDWPGLVLYASLENEEFADIQFVTLYSHCLDESLERNVHISEVSAPEHVEVMADRVVIVVDEDLIDDAAILRGLDHLTHVKTFEVGTKIELGPKKTFNHQRVH